MKFQSSCAHYGPQPQIEIGPKRGARFVRNFDMGTAEAFSLPSNGVLGWPAMP
jgi:hypothetical protein